MTLDIKPLTPEESIPYDLLYLADESERAVADYLTRGNCYVGRVDGCVVGEYVLLPTRPFTVELVNLAVLPAYQGQGYAKRLIYHALEIARQQRYEVMEIGTGDSGVTQLALYQKCGFEIYGVDYDFFVKHYDKPIFENGLRCRHMVRLRMDLCR